MQDPFQSSVRALLSFVAATAGAEFNITSYARTPEKQHVMHVGQKIFKGETGYAAFQFDAWPGVAAAGGREALMAMEPEARAAALQGIENPDALNIVWDIGTSEASVAAAQVIAEGYAVDGDDPCANGGPQFAWPTGSNSRSRHGSGKAVDAIPATLPNVVTISQSQAVTWPDEQALTMVFGPENIESIIREDSPDSVQEGYIAYKITGTAGVKMRDAFYDVFFQVQSAERAGFDDEVHFQEP